MQERPQIFIAAKDNMSTPSAVTTIGTRKCIELGAHKMLTSCASMSTAAEYPDLVYEI